MNIDDLKEIVKNCVYEEKGIACMNDTYYRDIMRTINNLQCKIDKVNSYIDDEIKKIQQHEYARGIRRLKKVQDILKEEII